MIRLFIYIALSLGVTAFAAWLLGLPGTVLIEIAGYRLQPGIGAAAVVFFGSLVVAIVIWAIIRRMIEAPERLQKAGQRRKRQKGVDALSDGYIALEAGDPQKARQLARQAQERLPENSAAQLLEARADLALGDFRAAREHYRALISNPKTALAALSGLFEQARAQNRTDAAMTFARKALTLSPRTQWAGEAVLSDYAARRDWGSALEIVERRKVADRQDRAAKKRLQMVLHTALARELELSEPAEAQVHADAALKLDAEFVPAALISARTHAGRGEGRRATSLLRRVYRATGHPQTATLYAHLASNKSAVDRLKRVRGLVGSQPQDRESALVLAQIAADAFEWALARSVLAAFIGAPTRGVCLVMAEIEAGEAEDHGASRAWLARAVRAPLDAAWVAGGYVLDEWEPVSPVTGKLDAFVWREPDSNNGADVLMGSTSESDAYVKKLEALSNRSGGKSASSGSGATAIAIPAEDGPKDREEATPSFLANSDATPTTTQTPAPAGEPEEAREPAPEKTRPPRPRAGDRASEERPSRSDVEDDEERVFPIVLDAPSPNRARGSSSKG